MPNQMKHTTNSLPFLLLAVIPLFGAANAWGIDWTLVDSPGNPAQGPTVRTHADGTFDGTGAVDYEFYIGTHEVTNAEYVEFLNAVASEDPNGLFHPSMQSFSSGGISRSGSPGSYAYEIRGDRGDWPVNFVSFLDAVRFANWLTNGKPSGAQTAETTEDGMYNLTVPPSVTLARDETAWENGGVAVPTLDEWFKAAFYDPDSNRYFFYATGTDQDPDAIGPNSSNPNSANYGGFSNVGVPTPVGGYSSANSPFGTFDQSGNVEEYTEDLTEVGAGNDLSARIMGGYFNGIEAEQVGAWRRLVQPVTLEEGRDGFRLARLLPPDDHGGELSTATPVDADSSTAGEIETDGDEDLFRVDVDEGGILTATTRSSIDTLGEILDDGGFRISSDDDSGNDPNFRIVQNLGVGTHYVRVSGSGGMATGPYVLDLSWAPHSGGGPSFARPDGWHWTEGDWEWSDGGRYWYWIPPGPPFVQNARTGQVVARPVEGWNFYEWPYFWNANRGVWFYLFQGNLPYVFDPGSGQWRRWGE